MPILDNAMQQPTPAGQPSSAAEMPPPNPEIMSPVVSAHMDELGQMTSLMDPKMADAYDRVLQAAMKMLYSKDNAEMMQQIILDDNVPIENKLGEGIANLLIMMDNTGNGTIPKEVIVPVGIAVMFEAADYLFELDFKVTEDELGKALELLIEGVLVGYGMDPKQVMAVVDDMGGKLGFDESKLGKEEKDAEAAEPTPDAETSEDAAMEAGFAADQQKQGK